MAFLERRRFNFFDLKENVDSGVIAGALGEARVTCTTHGFGFLILGDSSGNVHLIDKKFDIKTFRAYELNISLAEQCKLSPYLITIGEDEVGNPVIKVWHIERFDKNGIPLCLRISRASIPNKAVVPSCIAITDNLFYMAIGFVDGSILLYRGDVKRERTSKQKLLKDSLGSITGLAFHSSGKMTTLYVATVNSIEMYDVSYKDKERITNLDDVGCALRCSVLAEIAQDGHFFVAKNDAIYCYTNGVKGQCYAVDGEKVQLEWFKNYLVIIAKDGKSSSRVTSASVRSLGDSNNFTHVLTVLDIQNNSVTVFTAQLTDVISVLVEWGSFFILTANNALALVAEKDLQSKLALLFKKNLYDLAIRIAKSQQYDADGLMEIFRQYGDHLYSKGDHKGAIEQYIKTIGKLEPSYVIRKYLGSQQVEHLTTYLQALHKEGVATGGHTTLLLNFYTKLNKPELLKEFIMTKDREVDFDVEVAIDVCRHVASEDALLLAEKHSLHDWYLTIQIEDQKRYQAALNYIAKLDFEKAEQMIKKYGTTLLENIPEETTQFLKKICTDYHPSDEPLVSQDMLDGSTNRHIYKSCPEDFIHYFLNNSEKLVEFLEHLIKNSSKWSPQVYTTLLEHYLQVWGNLSDPNSKKTTEKKIMLLLESQNSSIDKLQALILCKAANFKPGLLMLYNEKKMYESMLKYYITHREYDEVPAYCQRSEPQRPGLWVQALWSLSKHHPVPTKHLNKILDVIGKDKLSPPILVIEALSNSPSVKIGNIRGYLKSVFDAELKKKNELTDYIEKCSTEIKQMKKSIEDFRTRPVLFQGSRCGICKKQLELPSVHFFCQDSFHQHCIQSFADNDNECPPCLEKNKQTLKAIKSEGGSNQGLQEDFHSQLETAEDGFSLATDYLGRGVFRKFSSVSNSPFSEVPQKVEVAQTRNFMTESYSSYQKNENVLSQLKRDQFVVKRDWKSDDVKGLLEKNLTYNAKNISKEEVTSVRRDERITAAVTTSTNPFGDDDDEEIDDTNPFANDLDDDNEDEEGDDYDKNLNPFS